MQQYRIPAAVTLAAACLALLGSSAIVAAEEEERSRTLRATGGTRNAACSKAEYLVHSLGMNQGHTIINEDGCKCTAERKTDYSGITREDWTCEIKVTYRVRDILDLYGTDR